MVKPKGLGRGLDALLSGNDDNMGVSDTLKTLGINQLQPGKYQPRSYMDAFALQTLADSIKSQGIMQPILVRQVGAEQYEIIAGERRWRASQIAGLTEVPVLVREIADESALAMALIENIQRENLNPLEEAVGIKRLIDEFDMTHEKAALAVGRTRVAVSNLLRLLSLCQPVQQMLMQNQLDMGHARTLIGLDPAKQVLIANKIFKDNLSVRQAEALVNQHDKIEKVNKATHKDLDVSNLQERLSGALGASVNITAKANGSGVVKINYSHLDQLDELIAKLSQG
jgi:ParB family transcriptional regulator, chromosome partitioning protein